jgi:hypothetical protein
MRTTLSIFRSSSSGSSAAATADAALASYVTGPCGTDWPLRLVVHPRARRLRLACDPVRGEFRLTVPPRTAQRKAIAWADGHRGWALEQASKRGAPERVDNGSAIPFYGGEIVVAWDPAHPRAARRVGDELQLGGPREAIARRVERWLKDQAREVMTRETHEYATRGGLVCQSVSIGDPRSRWGSCSARGTIRYNWRLIMAPDAVRRATVAHEVAHLGHLDHSARFHALHAALFEGDPVAARAWLRVHGQQLRRLHFA